MLTYTQKEISRLQDNLQLIRLAGGWSLAEFGDLLGVSKQTVSNLEGSNKNRNQTMSKLQYIGIRVILEYEVRNNPDNKLLAYVVNLVLGEKEPTKEELDKVRSAVAVTTGAQSTGLDSSAILSTVGTIIGIAAFEILTDPDVLEAVAKWLPKLLTNKDK